MCVLLKFNFSVWVRGSFLIESFNICRFVLGNGGWFGGGKV